MKKVMIIAGVALVAAVAAQAADVSVYSDFVSAYVFRGVTLNNGFVMQPGAEISGFRSTRSSVLSLSAFGPTTTSTISATDKSFPKWTTMCPTAFRSK